MPVVFENTSTAVGVTGTQGEAVEEGVQVDLLRAAAGGLRRLQGFTARAVGPRGQLLAVEGQLDRGQGHGPPQCP